MLELQGKTVLVCGATGALGGACADALGAAGADESLRDPSGRSAADWLAWSLAEHPAAGPLIPEGAESLLERVPRQGGKPAPGD